MMTPVYDVATTDWTTSDCGINHYAARMDFSAIFDLSAHKSQFTMPLLKRFPQRLIHFLVFRVIFISYSKRTATDTDVLWRQERFNRKETNRESTVLDGYIKEQLAAYLQPPLTRRSNAA
ncbi:hypothetical protein [Desulforhopalus sp. 52FAK]